MLLKRAIERYREKNQGPVLQRASRSFATLTLGSFCGLRADYDERGNPVLVGVRADGRTTLGVAALSDGTRDQLYLALRIASLEHHLETNPPLPFIVDDILVQFDDARAAAALQVLADLSDRTQVIFFTHHEHLLDVARQHVAAEKLFVHRLTGEEARRDDVGRNRCLYGKSQRQWRRQLNRSYSEAPCRSNCRRIWTRRGAFIWSRLTVALPVAVMPTIMRSLEREVLGPRSRADGRGRRPHRCGGPLKTGLDPCEGCTDHTPVRGCPDRRR